MDKSVIFAVAGSGKTTRLVSELDIQQRALLLTYTDNNKAELRRRIVAKFGYLPPNLTVSTYFTFLNSFCYRPLLLMQMKTKGISFKMPSPYSSRQTLKNRGRYVDASGRIFHARLAKIMDVMGCIPELQRRLERYFDRIYVDEVQDLGGHDFDLLMHIVRANVKVLLVGDFYQHTYSTSLDGNVNKSLHDDYDRYKSRFEKAGLFVDVTSLVASHRCSTTVCSFIREHIGVDIYPAVDRTSKVSIVRDAAEAAELYASPTTVKLFLQEHDRYGCYSQNWGASKGLDHYENVCVVLNPKTWKHFVAGDLASASPSTRNKLYVACSRTRGDMHVMPDSLLKNFKSPRPARHAMIA
ncbi:AAA family ATPase [Burkholderia sp. L27(2015)]|uniref:AAA family ATPase n=1 Tax=Burkholderia sp. L27(2015) TaxID=1641858 RepID=UPI00131AA764|nr:AAA family ATPase [Burkholderia sp. L27(2015)]